MSYFTPLKFVTMYQVQRFLVFSLAEGMEENFVKFKGVKTFASKEDVYNHFAQKFSLSKQRPSYVKKFDAMFEDCFNKGGFIDDVTPDPESCVQEVLVFGKSDEMEEVTFADYEVPMEHFAYVSGRERVENLWDFEIPDDLGEYDLHKNRLLEKKKKVDDYYTEYERDVDNLEEGEVVEEEEEEEEEDEEEEEEEEEEDDEDDDPELRVDRDLDWD